MNTPTNDYDALVLALKLAITADTDEKASACVGMAEEIAARLTSDQIDRAKIEAARTIPQGTYHLDLLCHLLGGAVWRREPEIFWGYDLPFDSKTFIKWLGRGGKKDLKLLETALEAADYIEETGHYELAAQHTTTGRPEIFRGGGR